MWCFHELDFEGFTANLLDFNHVIVSLTQYCRHVSTVCKDLAEQKSVISSMYIIQVPVDRLLGRSFACRMNNKLPRIVP